MITLVEGEKCVEIQNGRTELVEVCNRIMTTEPDPELNILMGEIVRVIVQDRKRKQIASEQPKGETT